MVVVAELTALKLNISSRFNLKKNLGKPEYIFGLCGVEWFSCIVKLVAREGEAC
jgi:hypothetical protein